MSNITNLKNYSSFVKECRFFYCQTVFDGDWDGREKFIVSSDTTENELWMKYPEIMKALSPYMFCNAACGDIYAESLKNINKFRKRSSNTIDFGAIEVLEDQMDIEAPELGIRLILSEGLSVCTPLQRERIQKYYATVIGNANRLNAVWQGSESRNCRNSDMPSGCAVSLNAASSAAGRSFVPLSPGQPIHATGSPTV